jgi:beta-galactosidase
MSQVYKMPKITALLVTLLLCICAHAEPRAYPPILLGTAWYPEQWPESRWEQDLQLMQNAGIHMVRAGEFAWSRMEPQEGRFDLDWLERAVALAARHDIVTVLGTPAAAPPAWLTQKYPDTLKTHANGRLATHGGREQYSFTSRRYREFIGRIAEQMAKRFGHNPNVIGWQIDNEYGDTSWDEVTRRDFQNWLRTKYKTLDSLNSHWTTEYWSESYTDWSQIPLGTPGNNPGLLLEFRRFVTDTYKSYQHDQLAPIRANADPKQFITSNFMGWYDSFNHYVLTEELDLASWDDYVGRGHLNVADNGARHDLTRGFKRKNFWVMETQPGFVNWSPVNNALDRGEVREMAWHAIGHGSDCVSYWQWRSALSGQEQYHGTLVGADGTPVPLYQEAAQLGREFAKAGEALAGTSPTSELAILHSYDSRWAINNQRHHQDFDPVAELVSYYGPLRTQAQQMDIVDSMAPLANYKLVVAPALNVLPEAAARHLIEYVQAGGHLVLGPRSGMKDEWNALYTQRQPGPLVTPLGGRVEQWYALNEEAPVSGAWGSGKAKIWAEQLGSVQPGAETIMTWGASNGWLDQQPAVLSRKVGKGRITYIAGWFDDGLMGAAAKWMLSTSGISPALGIVPEGVEVCRRTGAGKEVFVIVNHTKSPQRVALPRSMQLVLGGGNSSEVTLPPRGVEVLRAR